MLKQLKDRIEKSIANRRTYKTIMTTIPASASIEKIANAVILIGDYRSLVSATLIDKIFHPIITRRIEHLDFWTTCATYAFNS